MIPTPNILAINRAWKIIKKVLIGFLIFIAIISVSGWFYFKSHKEKFIRLADTEINHKLEAKVIIKDASISWFATFPYLSIALENIQIIDTSKGASVAPFLDAKWFYINCNLLSLIRGQININRVELSDGEIIFKRDSLGHSNLHLFDKPKKTTENDSKDHTPFQVMTLNNIHLKFSDSTEHKKYDLQMHHLVCETKNVDSATEYKLDINIHFNFFGLYTRDGTYGRNKDVTGKFSLYFQSKNNTISINNIKLFLNKEALTANGMFHLDSTAHFNLQLVGSNISFENASTTMLEKTQPLLSLFKATKPIQLKVDMRGDTKYLSVPLVNMSFTTVDNTLTTPIGSFTNCSLTGIFNNEVKKGMFRDDQNSSMKIVRFKGLWNGHAPVTVQNTGITNLIHPFAHLEIEAKCDLSDLDSAINSDDFTLESGKASLNLVFDGPLYDSSKIAPQLEGSIVFTNAAIVYNPKQMKLKKCNAVLKFNHSAFEIASLEASLGKSNIYVNGDVKSFAPIFTHSKDIMVLDCHVKSSQLDINDLVPLLGKPKPGKKSAKAQRKILTGVSDAMDAFTDLCDVHSDFFVKEIMYNRFKGENLKADITINNEKGWKINHLSINQGTGVINMTGSMIQDNKNNHQVSVSTQVAGIQLPGIFYSFNNFGLQELKADNLKGQVFMKADLNLAIDPQAFLVPGSFKGNLQFKLKNGAIINFNPLLEIGEKLYDKKHFSDIEFAELNGRFTVSNNIVKMKRMEIASSAMQLFVEGNYDLGGNNTDILIEVPVNKINLKNNEIKTDSTNAKSKKGLKVFVHAYQEKTKKFVFKYSFVKPQQLKKD